MSSVGSGNYNTEKDLRTRLFETIKKNGIKQIDVAREAGIHHSTLSLWLQRKFKGQPQKIEEAIDNWLQNFLQGKQRFQKKNFEAKINIFEERPTEDAIDEEQLFSNFELIPIRIDVEIEGKRFRENILWNLYEPFMTPEEFARILADENNLANYFEYEIASTIRKGVANHKIYQAQTQEIIKVIELDIRIGNLHLKDKFAWDINDPENNPEDFAIALCNDLGLNGEFAVQIAHSIREQILTHQRYIMDKVQDGKGIKTVDNLAFLKKSTRTLIESSSNMASLNLKNSVAPPIMINENNYLRQITHIYQDNSDNVNGWEPKLDILDPIEVKKLEKLDERKSRYVRRIK